MVKDVRSNLIKFLWNERSGMIGLRYKSCSKLTRFINSLPQNEKILSDRPNTWWIRHKYFRSVYVIVVEAGFKQIDITDLPETYRRQAVDITAKFGDLPEATEPKVDDPFVVLYLRPDAPVEVVRAAYHALCQLHHPDRGGNPDQFRRITTAYEKLVKNGS